MGEGKTPEAWDAWTARMKAEHGNGNGHGPSLAIEAMRLLPTPTAADRAASGGSTTSDVTLTDAIVRTDLGRRENGRLLGTPTAAMSERSEEFARDTQTPAEFAATYDGTWGQYADAITRWEAITRPAPAPTETGPKGSPRLAAAFSEWMMGLPAGWVTDVPGITRNEALKLCGNGVVPQQGAAAIALLLGRAFGEVAA